MTFNPGDTVNVNIAGARFRGIVAYDGNFTIGSQRRTGRVLVHVDGKKEAEYYPLSVLTPMRESAVVASEHITKLVESVLG